MNLTRFTLDQNQEVWYFTAHMKQINRIFKYVWPQWPDIILVVTSALVIATFLSISFVSIIPLLKLMMGNEGIHGWVERKIVANRYGMTFSTPDYTNQSSKYLIINGVDNDKKSPAKKAGLNAEDMIIDVKVMQEDSDVNDISRNEMLRILATATPDINFELAVRTSEDVLNVNTLTLNSGEKPWFADPAEKILSYIPREMTPKNKTRAVVVFIIGIGIITLIRCTAKFIQEYVSQKIVQRAINKLREDTFAHALHMPSSYFAKERPSDTVSRIVRDSDLMGRAIKLMLGKALREPLNALFTLGFAFWIDWKLTLIFMFGAPFVFGIVAVFGKKMKKSTRKTLMAGSQMLAKLQETMIGLRVVKVYNRHDYENEKFKAINDRFLKHSLKMSKIDAATTPVMEVLGMAAGAAAIITGAYWVNYGRSISPEDFFGLLILLGVSAESARKTSDVWNKIQEANAAADRVFDIMDSPLEYEKPDAITLPVLKNKIEFRDISFSYPGTTAQALKHVNLTIQAGHNVALVGSNGSGKTTLANLIPRFYDPESGHVLIDGQDIRDVTLFSLRNQIGMVTQNVVTFNDTVASNIAYGKPEATQEEIIEAAKRSFAHEFIEPLPNGYDTIIGEDGSGLSGGQLQRIIIARAILKNPAILIFDEATSQVDAESEAKIHKAIEEIMQNRTSIIIAHRFSTVISADVIVVMNKGQIVGFGQHDELIKKCQVYKNLYENQLVKS
ncbi:MAG: ABC transporter ATP-binding protein [Sedimentisphaerales bacterium]|nr:ABC transporter ATP-binding protein [Sedimentisphaerales bacterium]